MLVMVTVILYFTSCEYYMYATRSEEKARAAAEGMFERICERNGMDKQSFRGPVRDERAADSDRRQKSYSFLWTQNPEEEIEITVTYLPYDLLDSMSPTLIERNWKRRITHDGHFEEKGSK